MHAVRAPHAFDGHRFLDGGATVLVEDGLIVGVEHGGFVPPAGVTTTDLDGTLLPGLVDMHVHLVATGAPPGAPGSLDAVGTASRAELDRVVLDSMRQQARAGVTTVRDLGDVGYVTLEHRGRATHGLPRVVASGPPLTAVGGHCHFLGGVVDGARTVRDAVRERAERGVDVVKVMASGGFLTPGSDQLGAQFEVAELRVLVEAVHAAGLPVVAHAHSVRGAEVAVTAGVDGIEHFTCLAPGRMAAPDALLEEVARAEVTVDPTLGMDSTRLPPADRMPPHVLALLASVGVAEPEQMAARRRELARGLREHGIRVVSGLDAGAAPMKPHGHLWRALVELAEGGWPVAEVLASATSVAAEECGVPAGLLRPGLAADLLVVDGDPALDLGALARPLAVWVAGVPVDLS